MTDIAALRDEQVAGELTTLANRLYSAHDFRAAELCRGAGLRIAALARLTTPPLPEEIAGLIERWEKRIAWTAKWEIDDRLDNDTIAALRALAQEAQRWKTIATDWHRDCDDKSERIRELEAERDAIRRKTIEECADIAGRVCCAESNPVVEALRALAHSESEGKEES